MIKSILLIFVLFSISNADIQEDCFNKKIGKACGVLGKKYENTNKNLALRAYQQGLLLKDTTSMKYMGYVYWNDSYKSNKLRGIKILETVVSRGAFKEALFIGKLYAAGVSPLRKDFKKAEKYLLKAALMNKIEGSVPLAEFYAGKYGGRADYIKSNMWYDISANTGNEDSMFKVAQWNQDGSHGYKKNIFIAQRFWNLLSASGHDRATEKLKQYNHPVTYKTSVKYKKMSRF